MTKVVETLRKLLSDRSSFDNTLELIRWGSEVVNYKRKGSGDPFLCRLDLSETCYGHLLGLFGAPCCHDDVIKWKHFPRYWARKLFHVMTSKCHYSDVIMGDSNDRRLDCLLNRLFNCRSKKTSKLRVTGGKCFHLMMYVIMMEFSLCYGRLMIRDVTKAKFLSMSEYDLRQWEKTLRNVTSCSLRNHSGIAAYIFTFTHSILN